MTTPDPTALVAEALHEDCNRAIVEKELLRPGGLPTQHMPEAHRDEAERILAHPPLRAALELGLAWEAAVKALPEGWAMEELRHHDDRTGWSVSAFNDTGVGRYRWSGEGPTPAAALQALVARLTEGTRP